MKRYHLPILVFLVLVFSPPAMAQFRGKVRLPAKSTYERGKAFTLKVPTKEGKKELLFAAMDSIPGELSLTTIGKRTKIETISLGHLRTYHGTSEEFDTAAIVFNARTKKASGVLMTADHTLYRLSTRKGSRRLRIKETLPSDVERLCVAVEADGSIITTEAFSALSSGEPGTANAGGLVLAEVALVLDSHHVGKFGSVQGAIDEVLSVLAAVSAINERDNGLQYQSSEVIAITNSSQNPTSSTNSGTAINQFRNWVNSHNFSSPNDLAHLWTGVDFDGSVIGIAYLGAACGSYRVGISQRFTSNFSSLTVLKAHELGHNVDAEHDTSEPRSIMYPSISSTDFYSQKSINEITSYLPTASCIESSTANKAPVLDPIGAKSVTEQQLLAFTATASDPDAGDQLTFNLVSPPSGASINSLSGAFSYTPGLQVAGCNSTAQVNVTVRVSDQLQASDSEVIPITVSDSNQNIAPVLQQPANATVEAGDTVTVNLSASDADGDTISYSAVGAPAGSSLNAQTGVFSWTPGLGDVGSQVIVTFTATDCTTLSDSKSVTITVVEPVVPIISSLAPSEGYKGDTVQINGENLSGTNLVVRFGSKTATILSASAQAISVTVPRVGRSAATVDVVVSYNGEVSNAVSFNYLGHKKGGGGGGNNDGGGPNCGNNICDPDEDCRSCSSDCAGKTNGNPSGRYCCGNGIQEALEDQLLCDGNF